MTIRIKNWTKHQHFKDRTPPWIKLYREILDDPDWHELDGDTAKVLIGLWLIASEDDTHEGVLPETRKLAFRLRIKENVLNQHLTKLSNWLIYDDITTISPRYHGDAPETETETETEKPLSGKPGVFSFKTELLKLGADPVLVGDWLQVRVAKKARNTKTALDGFIREVKKSGFTYDQALRRCCEKNWSGFEAEWVANGKPPTDAVAVVPFDRAAYEADKKAALARMREEEAKYIVPPVGLRA